MMTDDEFVRYSRQICLKEIGELGQENLKRASVLIVGCGGLGNIVALYLAGAGIGRMVIADGDTIELSNLHRQIAYSQKHIGEYKASALKERIRELNSNCRVTAINTSLQGERLSLEVMMHDLVIDCSDNFKTRLDVNRSCLDHNTTLISGSAMGWEGQVMVFGNKPNSACYECLYPSVEPNPNSENCNSMGVVGPIVSAIASSQALVAFKILIGDKLDNTSWLYRFNGLNMDWKKVRVPKNTQCRTCK